MGRAAVTPGGKQRLILASLVALGLLLVAVFLDDRKAPSGEQEKAGPTLADAVAPAQGASPSPAQRLASGAATAARPASPRATASVRTTPSSADSLPCRMRTEPAGRVVADQCEASAPRTVGEAGAREFLEAHPASLGLTPGLEDLETVEVKHGLAGTRTLFAQRLAGLRIYDAHVSVNQNADGRITGLYSTYHRAQAPPTVAHSLSAENAEAIAREAAGVSALRQASDAEAVWFASSSSDLRLAWRLMIHSSEPLGDFLTVVDDASGKVLLQENRIAFATGSGFVYQPNPIQTSADTSLQDGNDATSPALDAERVSVTLLGLDDGIGTLRGEYVDLVSLAGGRNVPDADEVDRIYEYDRADSRFEQVVIYITVDVIQRRFHALGFDDDVGAANGIRDFPSLANAHWDNQDQSFYSTGDDAIHFGDGGVDDGEDADIIAHEYGHAIQHDQNACWGGGEMGAMGEGFGDYLAASFFADDGDPTFQASHAACVGEWDAAAYSSATPPCLRRVDGNKQYPGDLVGQVHADGEIWSRALWDLRQAIGATAADQLVLEHHFMLPCNASMTDAALEILQSDTNLNGSANGGAIRTAFCDRGILSGAECSPPPSLQLTQTISPNPPVAGQPADLTVTATNTSASPLTAVAFTANLPAGSSYVGGSASDAGAESAGVISWPPVDIGAGVSVQRSYQVVLDSGPGSATVFEDDMEAGSALWSVSRAAGTVDWTIGSAQPRSGTMAWFASEPAAVSDQRLATASPIAIESGTTLAFWHSYDTENTYDGGVVEASVDGGTSWTDLGSAITSNGYSGTVSTGHQSPIGGQSAFTGSSGGYVETRIDLQALAGNDALFRFRMTSDSSISGSGWHVDDVTVARVVSFESVFAAPGVSGATSTLTANVQPPPPNSSPQLAVNAGLNLSPGGSAVISTALLRATDADPGDTLTYTVTTAPANGALSPATTFTQAQIDAGGVSYQHDGGASLSDAFDFTVSDGRGGSIPATRFEITITPVNQAPALGLSALPSATQDSPYVLTVSPTDPDAGDVLELFLDAGPSWLGSPVSQGSNTWTLSGTPGAADVGVTSVQLRVRDSGLPVLEDQATLDLTVLPAPPAVPTMSVLARFVLILFGLAVMTRQLGARSAQG